MQGNSLLSLNDYGKLVEDSEYGKRGNDTLIFMKTQRFVGNYRLIRLTLVHGKIMEQIIWKLLSNSLETRR